MDRKEIHAESTINNASKGKEKIQILKTDNTSNLKYLLDTSDTKYLR